MCLYPKIIKNKKYIPNKKNGGNVPVPIDNRVLAVPVGCGKCMECKKQKARQWQVRLQEEIRENKTGKFVTLTFNNESIKELSKETKEEGYERDNEIATIAVRRFLERWRKKHNKSIKHWLITELGSNGTENIHLHGVLFTEETKDIKEIWKYGYVFIGEYVNDETIQYISKYVTKQDGKHKGYNNKILTSKGIGANYVNREDAKNNKYKKGETREEYKTRTGQKLNMPVYWRNKIYTEEEREKLWLEKLDKQERWVDGGRVDVSQGNEEYYKRLKTAREKNKRLGYGTDEKNWKEEEYEGMRRNQLLEKRINNAKETKRKK